MIFYKGYLNNGLKRLNPNPHRKNPPQDNPNPPGDSGWSPETQPNPPHYAAHPFDLNPK